MRKVGSGRAKGFGRDALRIKGNGGYANPVGLVDACEASVPRVFQSDRLRPFEKLDDEVVKNLRPCAYDDAVGVGFKAAHGADVPGDRLPEAFGALAVLG